MEILLNTIALEPNRWTRERIPYFQLEDLLQPIARAGFRGLEVWQYHVSRLFDREVARLKKDADALGLSFPVLGMYPAFHLEGDEREEELKRFERMLEIAALLGSRALKLMPGRIASRDLTPEQWSASVSFMQELMRRSEKAGTIFTLETHGSTLADDPAVLLKFIAEVGSARLKVCWQPIGFADAPKAIELFDRLWPHVAHVHLQGHRAKDYSPLEEADLDYRQVLAHMIKRGFDGYLGIEFVVDCVVDSPEKFRLGEVLQNAARDRQFLESVASGRPVPSVTSSPPPPATA